MCGIAGFFQPGGTTRPETLAPVLARLTHRGPDHQQTWSRDGIELGHARLSILDLSENGHQPIIDPVTGNAIVVNGEIYNFQVLREELRTKGYEFKSTGDSEVLLHLYAEYGEACLPMLRGMFAFAIWDNRERKLVIGRDRMGKKPLFYADTPSGFAFASEIRALSAHPAVSRDIDVEAMDLFLSTGSVPAPWSIYTAIRKLPPAHYGVVTRDGLSIKRYWALDFRQKIECGEEEALETIQAHLEEATRLRLVSDVPLGALLSGGVDSSLVVALMAKMSAEPVQTFTVGFEEKKYDETEHAAKVARHLGVEHHVEVLKPAGFEEMLPSVVRQYGEPFSDDASLASMLLSRATRRHVTVALGGDGGDELALGYSSYTHAGTACRLNRLLKGKPLSRDKVHALFADNAPWAELRRKAAFRLLRPELKHLLRTERAMDAHKKRIYANETATRLDNLAFDWMYDLSRDSYGHADNPVERMLWMDNVNCLPDTLLVKMDIASMAYGLEVRSPLLDHVLIEYMAGLPVELKIKNGETKYLLKKLAEKFIPKDVLYRPKQGFSMPVTRWIRGSAAEFTREAMSQAAPFFGKYFDTAALDSVVEEHITGRKNHKNLVWNLLNLALWAAAHQAGEV
ncbi:asparagine synthase (glutamine-hydrolyzing) [Pseudodesulfovibrio cashew]|uniref:asparagine synthase (glutamine-hydrolyzing) n=1 Tax=Pseudodesulfovibrio cashew TaxID=2678688 RepID=A0A6I6JL61_9BACT|nr:asparagine synthase (glutamine-hydrolyzing) [Pseudodesulfovibrio cashew]QGY40877.1 asparagine synthase (glutamine-hydrolyzing) [Pseudodesulfovibrio cashew]